MADTTISLGAPTPDDSHLPGLADLFVATMKGTYA